MAAPQPVGSQGHTLILCAFRTGDLCPAFFPRIKVAEQVSSPGSHLKGLSTVRIAADNAFGIAVDAYGRVFSDRDTYQPSGRISEIMAYGHASSSR